MVIIPSEVCGRERKPPSELSEHAAEKCSLLSVGRGAEGTQGGGLGILVGRAEPEQNLGQLVYAWLHWSSII